ncbi:MAG: hypothetical protein J0G30_08635 [Actinomycetales bacterium]|nr:hypothetical protein [Actinomycetales bacterium]
MSAVTPSPAAEVPAAEVPEAEVHAAKAPGAEVPEAEVPDAASAPLQMLGAAGAVCVDDVCELPAAGLSAPAAAR